MTYTPEMISKLLRTHGIEAEYTETRANEHIEANIFTVHNPKAVKDDILGNISDALEGTSIVSFKDKKITIERSYDIAPNPFRAYSKAIMKSAANIPVFLGESLDGYEIIDLKKDGIILICGSNSNARKNILNVALSSIRLSILNPQILIPKTSDDFLKVIIETERKQSETVIIIEDLPGLLYSEKGMKVEKMLYIKRNAKHLHFIAVNRYASADIITNIVKKTFPVRVTAQVSSELNSTLILGTHGAEVLNGDYDYLLLKDKTITHLYGAGA